MEIQNQHNNGTPTSISDADDYTSVAFWYQDEAHKVAELPNFKERTKASFANNP